MFEALAGTKGIIFDMRGYPQGTAWAIAPRLSTRGATYGAMFHRRFVDPTASPDLTFEFLQRLPTSWSPVALCFPLVAGLAGHLRSTSTRPANRGPPADGQAAFTGLTLR